jgi:predicted amidophosphoribosyltransferase
MKTSDKIITYITQKGSASGRELADYLQITDRAVRKQLSNFLEGGLLEKVGKPPRVYYRLPPKAGPESPTAIFDSATKEILEANFYHIGADGRESSGEQGFSAWSRKRNFDPVQKATEFVHLYTKYQGMRQNGLLDATKKMQTTFGDQQAADRVYYYDFYAIEVFGKTKTGQKLLYAKQSQNRTLMRELAQLVRPVISALIKREKIDAVAYVPPTVQRETQFMKVIERELALQLPRVGVEKVITDIRVPQKTLKRLADRIENADATFVVASNASYQNVLVIDDAVGSGASINQIATKLKARGVAKEVIGFAITGSLNDFDVISEV